MISNSLWKKTEFLLARLDLRRKSVTRARAVLAGRLVTAPHPTCRENGHRCPESKYGRCVQGRTWGTPSQQRTRPRKCLLASPRRGHPSLRAAHSDLEFADRHPEINELHYSAADSQIFQNETIKLSWSNSGNSQASFRIDAAKIQVWKKIGLVLIYIY